MKKLLLMALALIGCTQDLSNKPIIKSKAAATASSKPLPAVTLAPAGPPWNHEMCRPSDPDAPPRPNGTLTFSGECAFKQSEQGWCRPLDDDFYILERRTLAGGHWFIFYVNVERHHGPGDYPGLAQIHIEVRDGQSLYRWSNYQGSLLLTADARQHLRALFKGVRLTAEPGTLASGSIVVDGTVDCLDSSDASPFPAPIQP